MNFRNHYFVLLFSSSLLFGKFSYSQQQEDLIGDWNIIKVELAPNSKQLDKQLLEMAAPIFLKSTFHFKDNKIFSFDSPNKELAIKDAIWEFDNKKKYVNVFERVAKGIPGKLMGIIVKIQDGKYSFFVEESPLILTVEKKSGKSE